MAKIMAKIMAALLSLQLVSAASDKVCSIDADRNGCGGSGTDEAALLQHRSAVHSTTVSLSHPTCGCEAFNPLWSKTRRTDAKCVFIDLGANRGDTFKRFLNGTFFNLSECPNKKWEAHLVEANPRFEKDLMEISMNYSNVNSFCPEAAFHCGGKTDFYLDTVNPQHHYWGSSMSGNTYATVASGRETVSVKMMNVIRLLYEKTLPQDVVLVKMDIEGAEWDILPCLAQSSSAQLMDRLFCEVHQPKFSSTGKTTRLDFQNAQESLRKLGVEVYGWE